MNLNMRIPSWKNNTTALREWQDLEFWWSFACVDIELACSWAISRENYIQTKQNTWGFRPRPGLAADSNAKWKCNPPIHYAIIQDLNCNQPDYHSIYQRRAGSFWTGALPVDSDARPHADCLQVFLPQTNNFQSLQIGWVAINCSHWPLRCKVAILCKELHYLA